MEAHSRAWLLRCPHCGHERSIWAIGGIRYKAAGESRTLMRCPNCGQRGWHKLHKAANFPVTQAPAWPLVRLVFLLTVAGTLVIAMIVAMILAIIFLLVEWL